NLSRYRKPSCMLLLFHVKMKHPLVADEPFEVVADSYGPHARRGACENKVTLPERDILRYEHQNVFEGKNQVSRISLLYRFPIFIQPETQVIQIAEGFFGVQRADRG